VDFHSAVLYGWQEPEKMHRKNKTPEKHSTKPVRNGKQMGWTAAG